jgi:uncharacterized cofD-like protein
VLRALLELDYEPTAVVTMADDGGSSGLLRQEIGILPPGDARNCLVALADADELRARVFGYRFPESESLSGHALGNLAIAALTDLTGSFPEALRVCGEWLGSRGTVLPSTLADVVLSGRDREGEYLRGQALIAENAVPVDRVSLEPEDPEAYPPALEAIASADLVVLGPGSLYTSVIPNLLVAGIAAALRETAAPVVYLCNVANLRGETIGLDAADHARALLDHGLEGALDVVAVHDEERFPLACEVGECVRADRETRERIERLGPRVVTAELADPADPAHHGLRHIAEVLRAVA